ncbi:MAG: D-2-hydroxyacid dehydrogenase [Clostridiales bacterium]|nr:D-2-hydroxyacid dehydrogenase [Clostridiales bacterium]
MQIVILDGHGVNPGDMSWEPLKAFGTLSVYDRTDESMVEQRLRGAQIVLTNKVKLPREILTSSAASKLRFVGVLATGYDVVDIAAAREAGVTVCNVPAYSTEAVAQLTFALLLELSFGVGLHNALVHQGAWTASPDFCFWTRAPEELSGKTLGILGCGLIGSRVAQIGAAFGMTVIGCSRTPKPTFPGKCVDFETLLRDSDVLSLHIPATPDTVGIINRDTIAKMKDGAYLLNTARGVLLNEQDVADALASGKLAGVGVDVVSREPIARSNPLLAAPNCVITGHYGWAPKSARQRLIDITCENIRVFLAGTPQNVVNS